jgi:NAD(P)-dependent dehydrogenase (short-subunit alcohol dehydrogenase family)
VDLELKGKTALVTGGSRGIGFAISERFAMEGCALKLVSRQQDKLDQAARALRERHGAKVEAHAADLGKGDEVRALYPLLEDIDILVNCAGDTPRGSVLDNTAEALIASFNVKAFAAMSLSREAILRMKERGGGVIVNIIGTSGEKPNPKSVPTAVVNASLMAFTQAVGSGSVDYNVRMVGVNPGLVATDRTTSVARPGVDQQAHAQTLARLPWGRMAKASEVADLVAFLASPRAGYVSGTIHTIDAGQRLR